MAQHAGASIPKACASWAESVGAYRLLSNAEVNPHDVQGPHREDTRKSCAGLPVVLAVSDITDLDFTGRTRIRDLGKLGDGRGRGLQQHTTLAVEPGAGVIGVLRQHWYARPEAASGETRRERNLRWREPDVWAEAARAIGVVDAGCRVIHVADRGADVFSFLNACMETGAGFVIRAWHDRKLAGGDQRLWERAGSQPVLERFEVKVTAQRTPIRADRRVARTAKVALRTAQATIPPPRHDARASGLPACQVHVVHVLEEGAPEGAEIVPVEWLLLTSEPVTTAADARRIAGWYAQRWVVEEFHRVEKEGCRLEATQLDDAADIMRLAAITAVVAIRLLKLRDLADPAHPRADDARAVREFADEATIRVVAKLSGIAPTKLTPKLFLSTVARRGGWLGRRSDPRPGWKCLWSGWREIDLMAQGAALLAARGP